MAKKVKVPVPMVATVGDAVYNLSRFNAKVGEALGGRFFERVQKPWGAHLIADPAQATQGGYAWHFEFDGPDEDAVTAFVTRFGFFQKGNDKATNVYDTSRLYYDLSINQLIPQDLLDDYKARRDALVTYWKTLSPVQVFDFSQDSTDNIVNPATGQPVKGRRYPLTNAELFRIFLFGRELHADKEEERILHFWEQSRQYYPLLLTLCLGILAQSFFIIQEMADVHTRTIAHLQTLNQGTPLTQTGSDPTLDPYNPNTAERILHLLGTEHAALILPMDAQPDGTFNLAP